jgi:hypothetical protein
MIPYVDLPALIYARLQVLKKYQIRESIPETLCCSVCCTLCSAYQVHARTASCSLLLPPAASRAAFLLPNIVWTGPEA